MPTPKPTVRLHIKVELDNVLVADTYTSIVIPDGLGEIDDKSLEGIVRTSSLKMISTLSAKAEGLGKLRDILTRKHGP